MSEARDRTVVQCNATTDSSAVRAGAPAYVSLLNPGWSSERIVVVARSRGGRWISYWAPIERFHDFRIKTLPPEHPRWGDERVATCNDAHLAQLLDALDRKGPGCA